jgi:type VI secretion system protein ImpA
MPVIDIEKLLQPVSSESPCGENLEYDALFLQMEQAAQAKPDQQFGDTIVPGEEPDWRNVKRLGLELLDRTRDLRVLAHLSRALVHTNGMVGFGECMDGMHQFVAKRWDTVHPQLDPDDDNDPTLRVNLLASLCDSQTTLKYLREMPLVRSRTMGQFSLRDYEVAAGEAPPPAPKEGEEEAELPKMETIQAAFRDCDVDELQADAAACRLAIASVGSMEAALTDQVGAAQSTSLDALVKLLRRMSVIFDEQLSRRGVGQVAAVPEGVAEGSPANASAVQQQQSLSGEIHSRDDVIRAIEKICDYYRRLEPSSPVPLLLRRAKRLANMSFLEIVRDLSPDAMQQVLALGGEDGESDE